MKTKMGLLDKYNYITQINMNRCLHVKICWEGGFVVQKVSLEVVNPAYEQ
jgi:hypothetical protein